MTADDGSCANNRGWVNRVESYRRVANSVCDPLSMILPAVNADYHQLALILRFELPQLRKYVDAVDSAIRPEVQKDHFPPEFRKLEFPSARMDPVEIVGKLGSAHCRRGCELSGHRLSSLGRLL